MLVCFLMEMCVETKKGKERECTDHTSIQHACISSLQRHGAEGDSLPQYLHRSFDIWAYTLYQRN